MTEESDEDILSLQLESSLTLIDDEDDSEKNCNRSIIDHVNVDVKKNLVVSINPVYTPVKSQPMNAKEEDLRKLLLVRKLKSATKDDTVINESVHSVVTDKEMTVEGNEDANDKVKQGDIEIETKNCAHDSDSALSNNTDNVNTLKYLEKEYIILEEVSEGLIQENKNEVKEVVKTENKSGLDVDYVSKDPSENADNNNPDWQLIQKLKTDEERYRAVRERWRNLIVPEPNKDLTCFTWCRTKPSSQKNANENKRKGEKDPLTTEEYAYKGRKRTFSSSGVESPVRKGRENEKSEKRLRTHSCTRVYGEKIAALRRHASEECLKITYEQKSALDELEQQYLLEKRSLSSWSLTTGHSIHAMLDELDEQHYRRRQNVMRSYDNLSHSFWNKQASQLKKFEDASAEVLAFHSFYQGLDKEAPESMALTEEQLEEIDEINSMYESFCRFYEE